MSDINFSRTDAPLNHDGIEGHNQGENNLLAEQGLVNAKGASDINRLSAKSPAESSLPSLEFAISNDLPAIIEKPGNYSETLMIDGIPRDFHLHVPPNYDPSKQAPLVLVLHGHGDDAAGVARESGMDVEADKKRFIVAYPEAVHWLEGKSVAAWDTGNGLLPPLAEANDVGFLRKVIDTCQSKFNIDQNRTYLVGFSNGGMEAYKAAGELSDKLAAVAAISGAMSGSEAKPKLPVSMLSIVGTADDGVPLAGRTREEEADAAAPEKMRMLGSLCPLLNDEMVSPVASEMLKWLAVQTEFVPVFKPVTYATDFWRSADGITAPAVTTQKDGISTETYSNSQIGVAVKQEIVAGGDHMIQHGAPAGFNLADEIWNFLNDHPRKQS